MDAAALGVATAKLSRLLSRDKLSSFPSSVSEVEAEPRIGGARRAVDGLVTCPCTGQWVRTALAASRVPSPAPSRFVSRAVAAPAVAGVVQSGLARALSAGEA